jgi:hypothetical protein
MELHIRDVSKTYANGVQALNDVSLTIRVNDAQTFYRFDGSPQTITTTNRGNSYGIT